MAHSPYLSIIIPCYNEVQNIKKGVLDKIEEYLTKQSYTWEVIIVDDGSEDASRESLTRFVKGKENFSLITNPHRGKAYTVTTGVLAASGDHILFTDFDQATPISELPKLLEHFPAYDVVIGSRKGSRKGAPFTRRLMARGFMLLRSVLLHISIEDTQCGFKAFKREAAQRIFQKLTLYAHQQSVSGSRVTAGFDVEVLFIAQKLGYKIKEVPVGWRYVETRRVSMFRDSLDGVIDLVRIALNELLQKYA